MAAPILPISGISLPQSIGPAAKSSGGGGFQDVLASAIQQVESAGQAADTSVQRFLSGEGGELHTTILATQQAEMSFDLFMQARNKVVSAYQEIMKMQM
jgi:flagellar hook-basal body complex protein FliE